MLKLLFALLIVSNVSFAQKMTMDQRRQQIINIPRSVLQMLLRLNQNTCEFIKFQFHTSQNLADVIRTLLNVQSFESNG